mmetsp:Transcript_4907/g.7565  ORF Transcript_4907/g.7565 Transcript_4907/m.7565 type:complete len:89 (+) Transcript_4907:493-759(+)
MQKSARRRTTAKAVSKKRRCAVGACKTYMFKELTTPEKMKQCFHKFSCQKNKSLNNTMSLFAPKNKTFSLTSSLLDRSHFVVILDSEM